VRPDLLRHRLLAQLAHRPSIGRVETDSRFFTRVLHLINDPNGRSFLPDLSVVL